LKFEAPGCASFVIALHIPTVNEFARALAVVNPSMKASFSASEMRFHHSP
jgi:hypothetical protein